MKAEILEQAKAVFGKYKDVQTLYVTSDGNIFRVKHYADSWKASLTDKAVTPLRRADVLPVKAESTTDEGGEDTGEGSGSGSGTDAGKEERDALVKRHIELFDTKPSHFMKNETIAAKIAEKEKELAEQEKEQSADKIG